MSWDGIELEKGHGDRILGGWVQPHSQTGHSPILACVAWSCLMEVFWDWWESPAAELVTIRDHVGLGKYCQGQNSWGLIFICL